MSALQRARQYGKEDANTILDELQEYFVDATLDNLVFEPDYPDDGSESTNVTATYTANGNTFDIVWTYIEPSNSDEILMDKDTRYLAEVAINKASRTLNSSTSLRHKRRIVAADEDEFLDDEDLMDTDDSFNDSLDNLADQVEDMQEQVDEVQEDDISIEMDNNIDGHYIAECEKCHGVFISAVIESDQKVEKIAGTCPLCQKDSDQYLNWVIRSVNE